MVMGMALRVFVLLAVLRCVRASSFCQQVVEPLGYGCAEFTVQTGDGFVLALHRLSKSGSLTGYNRADSPASTPVFAPSPAQGNRDVEAYGPAPSPMVSSEDRNITNIYNSSKLTVASAHIPQAPKIPGNRNIDLDHSYRTSNNQSSELPAVAAGPAASATQTPRNSSTPLQRQRTTEIIGSPSNYTVHPWAGNGAPVLLLHQEFVSGEIWLELADGNQNVSGLLPIMLLNDGFDVWIGHSRATYWGHGHVQLRPTDREYWNWTWDQHVQYDLPAHLLFVSTETNQPVHFIGASQAAAVGAAAATDHESAQMIRSLTLIGPTAYRGYTNSRLLEAWAYYFGLTLDSEYYISGYQSGAFNYSREFPQSGPFSAQGLTNTAISLISVKTKCGFPDSQLKSIKSRVVYSRINRWIPASQITGPNCCLSSSAPLQFTNGWDGTTPFKNLLHWQQGIRTNTFAHYDYGSALRNMQAYGRPAAPVYDVALIPTRMPVLIIGGGQDYEAPPHGIRLLLSQLHQPAMFINLTNYAHYDLGFSMYREKDIFQPILKFLEGQTFP